MSRRELGAALLGLLFGVLIMLDIMMLLPPGDTRPTSNIQLTLTPTVIPTATP